MNSPIATDPKHRKPFYYVRKRFLRNKPAVFGLVVIVLAHIIALLGYLIMPDNTPNANDSAPQIRKQTPGFKTTLLKTPSSFEVEEVSFIDFILRGQDSRYTIEPILEKPWIENDSVFFILYPGIEKDESTRQPKAVSQHLLRVVRPVYVSPSEKLGPNLAHNYFVQNDSFVYLDLQENYQVASRETLIKEFWEYAVEERSYLLGTDQAGRDMLSRLLFGTRISLSIGFMSVLISLFVGVFLGSIAGFFGGRLDNFVTWLMTVVWSIPNIMLVIVISLLLEKGLWVVYVSVGLTMWVDIARIVRGEILSIKEKTFVEAAHAFGFSSGRIIFRHILPNIAGALIVISTSNFANAILIEAGLSFLGFGVEPPMPSWGIMVKEGFDVMTTSNSWHLIVLPSLCISFMVLAFNLFGNGLRDAYDPKTLN